MGPSNAGKENQTLIAAVTDAIREGQSDYGLEPLVMHDASANPVGRIANGDSVVFCCRRGEREIELTEAFTEAGFPHFERPDLTNLHFVILTLYHEKFKDLPVAFAPVKLPDTLGELVSRAGKKQLRIAESEKFAHVTFFLNGGYNQPFDEEMDIRIPSPKGIPFQQVPELSLQQVADAVIKGIQEQYDLVITNFANGDVIGHTADQQAKIECARVVDFHLKRVVEKALAADYAVVITSDHGNLEVLLTQEGHPHVAHTTNPVPFILLDPRQPDLQQPLDGRLADIAPTILDILNIKPAELMDGKPLVASVPWGSDRRVLLVILDGWGIGAADDSNPIYTASTPFFDKLFPSRFSSQVAASGSAVGLSEGKPGNSEAGHMNIGAGRVVLQDDMRLQAAIKDGTIQSNPIILSAIDRALELGTNLHLIGMLSEKSSHGSIEYPLAVLQMARARGLKNVFLHLIFDGRSTEPGSGPALIDSLEKRLAEIGIGKVVSAVGRGLALDRAGNYAKVKKAFDAFVFGIGTPFIDQENS